MLLVADEGTDVDSLRTRLGVAGLAADSSTVESVGSCLTGGFEPAAVLLVFGERGGEGRLVALARSLRSDPSSFGMPVVLLFREDTRALRSAAQHLGADDYFSRDASAEELEARLASLCWRAEAGRRGAPSVADQRSEIDNFLFLLDAVGADARRGATGSLALVEADGDALAQAHGFLKLNLRRLDAVAFYGPATLLVYLPGADSAVARATLARLREEFAGAYAGGALRVGVSSFPAHGTEVERLVEQAEAALGEARGANPAARVVVYGMAETGAAAGADAERRVTKVFVNEPQSVPAKTPTGAPKVGGRTRRVMLVVSDSARMAQVNLLLRSAAYEVRAAFDGQHALNLLRIDRPDALVVDYELREMDGVEMLRRFHKQSRAWHAPPALLLAPAGREDLRAEALGAGARGVIELPYDAVELIDRLGELCETE